MLRFRIFPLVAMATFGFHSSRAVAGRAAGIDSSLVCQFFTRESALVLRAHGRSSGTGRPSDQKKVWLLARRFRV